MPGCVVQVHGMPRNTIVHCSQTRLPQCRVHDELTRPIAFACVNREPPQVFTYDDDDDTGSLVAEAESQPLLHAIMFQKKRAVITALLKQHGPGMARLCRLIVNRDSVFLDLRCTPGCELQQAPVSNVHRVPVVVW